MRRNIRNDCGGTMAIVSLSSCSRRSNILINIIILLLWIGSNKIVVASTSNNNDNNHDDDNRQQHRRVQCPKECLVDHNNNKHDNYQKSTSSRSLKNNSNKNKNTYNSTTATSSSSSNNENERSPMTRIFYFILIHNKRTANDAVHLFRSIRNSRNIILFHIDMKAIDELKPPSQLFHNNNNNNSSYYNNADQSSDNNNNNNNTSSNLLLWNEILYCPCGSIIQIVSKYSIKWGHWNMTEPTLYGINIATSVQYYGLWDIFINLSGDTIPIYKVNTMASKLYDLYPYNFVTSSSCETNLIPTNIYHFPKYFHKRKHYTNDETESNPIFIYDEYDNDGNIIQQRNITIITYFGSQWIIIQSTFCLWLSQQLQIHDSWVNQYRIYLIKSNKLMSDETFIPTILMHSPFRYNTIPIVVGNNTKHFIRHQNYYPKKSTHHITQNNNKDNDNNEESSKINNNNNDDGLLINANGTISNIYHVRYERMDEHMPSAYGYFASEQHYDVSTSLIDVVDVPRVWGPYYLGIYDLGNIKNSGALFIRKISSYIDSNILSILPVNHINEIPDIYWPNYEIQLSSKPNWEQKIKNLMNKHQKEKEQQQKQKNNNNNQTSSQQAKMRRKDIEDESTTEQNEDDSSYQNYNNDDAFDPIITTNDDDRNEHHISTDNAYHDAVQEDSDGVEL